MFSKETASLAPAIGNRVRPARELEYGGGDVLSTGLGPLDAILPGGGFQRGRLSEISGRRSSGKRALALALCSWTLEKHRTRHAAWIDGSGGFYPLVSLEHGVPLERLIVVNAPSVDVCGRHGRERRRKDRRLLPALKAADILLSAGDALALLIVDLPPGTAIAPRLLSRLRLGVETSGVALVFVTEVESSAVGSSGLLPSSGQSLGTFICLWLYARRAEPDRLVVAVAKSKRGKMAHHAVITINDPHSVRLDTTV